MSTARAQDGQPGQYGFPWPYTPGAQVQVPGPPVAPVATSRGATWPGGSAYPQTGAQPYALPYNPASPTAVDSAARAQVPNAVTSPYRQPPNVMGGAPAVATPLEPCEGAQILARVGSEVVLASEVLPAVNEILARYEDSIPASQLDEQRKLLIQQQLQVPIETKLIYLDACRTIPAENLPRIEQSVGEQFDKTELKRIMQSAGVETREQLDAKLRSLGTSIEQRKQAFIQRTIAQSWAREQMNQSEEVTYEEMLEYYRQHLADYERPARARWEELVVHVSKHPSKDAAYAAIARMGNQVLAGIPLAEVARDQSDGSTAAEGGARDWTCRGSLVSETLDHALFALPVGQCSPILEDDGSLLIVRVVEREDAGRVPFAEAQTEIRPKLVQERTKGQLAAYVDRLRKQTPVWTVFDDPSTDRQVSERETSAWR